MKFSEAIFDGVWAVCSLGHITKKALPEVLAKIYSMLKEGGCFYWALRKGHCEELIKDSRYPGNIEKFWSFYQEDELKELLEAAQFKIIDFAIVAKNHPYQTQDAFRVFCQKI